MVNIKTTITVFYYLYRELLPKVKVPTKLARLVRWLRATFPIQIERNIYNGIFCWDMLKTYQRQIKLLAFSLDRNREEFKIKKKNDVSKTWNAFLRFSFFLTLNRFLLASPIWTPGSKVAFRSCFDKFDQFFSFFPTRSTRIPPLLIYCKFLSYNSWPMSVWDQHGLRIKEKNKADMIIIIVNKIIVIIVMIVQKNKITYRAFKFSHRRHWFKDISFRFCDL